jgi:SAM-dependent methyltransferase
LKYGVRNIESDKVVLTLQRNVQFLYEEHLTHLELKALGCGGLLRDEEDWRVIHASINSSSIHALVQLSAYVGDVNGSSTVYQTLTTPNYQGGRFNRTRSVNQYLTHWIYPYRGKFHPQLVRALLNILGARPGQRFFEPFLGSGTAALEASLYGMEVSGVDLSPLCVLLTRVKTQAWEHLAKIRPEVASLISRKNLNPLRLDLDTYKPKPVRDFFEMALMVTHSDVARRGRALAVAFEKNVKAMLESIEAQALAIAELKLQPGKVSPRKGDSRKLSNVEDRSIDIVVTSPPYSIALDYVKNDEHALQALGIDQTELSSQMTGVRGKGAKERMSLYNSDMKEVFSETARILRPGGKAAFVVGNATVDGREITTVDEMADWAVEAGLTMRANIPKIVFGLYNVMQDERILIFEKERT